MALKGRDREFRLGEALVHRLQAAQHGPGADHAVPPIALRADTARDAPHAGTSSRSSDFVERVHQGSKARFVGFDQHPDIVARWIETDLMDMS